MVDGFKAFGCEVAYFAFAGLHGGKLKTGDTLVLPPAFNMWGSDIVKAHKTHFKADAVLTHWDIWAAGDDFAEQAYPWVPYFPLDQYPVPPRVLERALECYQPVVYSKFALAAMREAGVECAYVPHGIDCDIFKPMDKMECRRHLGFPEDAFVIGMVAANTGYPSRKAIPESLLAFEQFRRRHSDAVLYLHMYPHNDDNGVEVPAIIQSLGLPPGSVKLVDEYQYLMGLPDQYLADAYNSMNVLHAASMGEGFGLPIVEAQACGTRVVTTNCSSMPENTFDGIVTEPAQRLWTQLDSWAVMPSVENMVEAWERIYAGELGDPFTHSQKAIEGARKHDWPLVLENYWKPFLEQLEARLKGSGGAYSAVSCGDRHRWSRTGLWEGDTLRVPCLRKWCPAEMAILPNGRHVVRDTGFAMETDGVSLDIEDDPNGGVAKIVYREIGSSYGVNGIPFDEGNVVLDLGAHVGVVSIYVAKHHPGVKVYAFEPVAENFKRLRRNVKANGVEEAVVGVNLAVTGDGRDVVLSGYLAENSGGATIYGPPEDEASDAERVRVHSLTLRDIFDQYVPGRCKLLKIDVEGAEYEILEAAPELLDRVDYLAIEAHANDDFGAQGRTPEKLRELCEEHIDADHIFWTVSQIGGREAR